MSERLISLRGVEVHNLQGIDLDLPHRKLIVFCGVSGSGKSSLAFDTIYAEGQRRYIESFSAYTRQFLERLEKPAAQRIDGISPAIAVAASNTARSSRATVGTSTEAYDYLRLLLARVGRVFCRQCGREVVRHAPQSVAAELARLPAGTRYMVAFPWPHPASVAPADLAARIVEEGFVRAIVDSQMVELPNLAAQAAAAETAAVLPLFAEPAEEATAAIEQEAGEAEPKETPAPATADWQVIIDRLTAGSTADERLRDSLEAAFDKGRGQAVLYVEETAAAAADLGGASIEIDGRAWRRVKRNTRLVCDDCGLEYPQPDPRLFSFNSPLGACPECEGFGNVVDIDMDLVVPDKQKTIREGAIAPWNTPAYAHERDELVALAKDYKLPIDVPFAELNDEQRRLILEGVPEREFGGLRGFFAWLERRKYKMHVRVFLSRWRSYRPCPACGGARLRPEALAVRIGGKNIAEICAMPVDEAEPFVRQLPLSDWERAVGRTMLEQVQARLVFLCTVGLGYLTLDRTLRTLSGGESQRVALTSALGSNLVNMLYVLDEPSVGLHMQDTARLVKAITGLRDRGNTVIVVEHEEEMIRAADMVVEIGPAAGERGGRVVFQGTPREMEESTTSLTGDYLSGRRMFHTPEKRRAPNHGWIRLAGARGNNLQNLSLDFPLGVLCVVTGVSGAGKSTLVEDTLYPALCRRMRKEAPAPAPCDDVFGDGQINDVILVDQSPIGRSPRSNPVTYIKAFDEIRNVFADTLEARTRNYTASHFSFNVEGGRCAACNGDGYIQIDMQFLADVYMKCGQCHGRRYRQEILDVTYRGRNIADVLEMTVREAFTFFRGSPKVQTALKKLIDVGLDYLRLGQPANTLSGGEAQRLKLAGYMSSARRSRTLFILDEPTTGLHFFDIVQLLDCFEALLAVGHSLIVVEHNLQVMKAADYIIDLGPGAAAEGGRVVAQGTPEFVSRNPQSITGRYLAQALAKDRKGKSA
ncbi:MAG TPA: excinuclease ABC subunit UvrA [Pirellulales bacterium]|nr:excinuclease ABC subunit UvrA [Pirellulales bacterium]